MKTIYYIVDNKYRDKKIDWKEIVSLLVGGSIMVLVFWGFLIII